MQRWSFGQPVTDSSIYGNGLRCRFADVLRIVSVNSVAGVAQPPRLHAISPMPQRLTSLRRAAPPLVLFLLLLGFSVTAVWAQGEVDPELDEIASPTRTIAVRNARIVTAPGKVIERGTLVMRAGTIAAVGPSVAIPPDAEIIEGEGLTLYPGFIDALGDEGIVVPKVENLPKVPRPGDPPNDRAGIRPERDARNLLDPNAPSIDSMRRLGYTVAQVAPRDGMLPGTAAVIRLGGRGVADVVVSIGSATVAQFAPVDDIYPATRMAIMAKMRDLVARARQVDDGHRNLERPAIGDDRLRSDPSLDALIPTARGERPLLFATTGALDAVRAFRLGRELKLPTTLLGSWDIWTIADTLAAARVPVLLSLALPAQPAEGDSAARRRDSVALATQRNSDAPLRELTEADTLAERGHLLAARNRTLHTAGAAASELVRRKLPVAFASWGARRGEIRSALRAMARAGMSEQEILAALTVQPARVLGLEKTMGTIETGKAANLVAWTGSMLDSTAGVRYTFIAGRRYSYDASRGSDTARTRVDTSFSTGTLPVASVLRNRAVGARRGSLLIRNATVLTVASGGTLENTDIAVENGKIVRIGRNLPAPSGAETIDATGMYVMPGIIDAHSHIGITDVNEWTNPVTAEVNVGDVLDGTDISIYHALAGGVTISHAMHGSANAIGGQCRTIKHRYGEQDPNALTMEGAPRTIKFALGENPTRVHGRGFGVRPSTRMGMEQVYRTAFNDAQRYGRAQEEYRAGRRNAPPPYSLRMETLAAILRGEIIVHCHSYRADEILMLMRVLRDFGIKRVVFQHVNEGFKVAPELAQFGAMASVFADWWAYKFEVYYSTAYNAAILTRNGVVTSINSDSPELDRHLYHEAAKTMKYGGLTKDEAVALITINPARQLGIEDRVGSIEVGKEADLAIFTAHPLSIYARCRTTIVDGVVRFDDVLDPDDMRMEIDPSRSVDEVTTFRDDRDHCMDGTEHLFEEEGR